MKGILGFILLAVWLSLSEQTSYSKQVHLKEAPMVSTSRVSSINVPGIGYYFFFIDITETFDNAELICEQNGGHLAIINSQEEADALVSIFAPYVGDNSWARLGFGDWYAKGDFRTIFGEPLSDTGFVKWGDGEPGLNQDVNCGCLSRHGMMGTQICTEPRYFLCEGNPSLAGGSK